MFLESKVILGLRKVLQKAFLLHLKCERLIEFQFKTLLNNRQEWIHLLKIYQNTELSIFSLFSRSLFLTSHYRRRSFLGRLNHFSCQTSLADISHSYMLELLNYLLSLHAFESILYNVYQEPSYIELRAFYGTSSSCKAPKMALVWCSALTTMSKRQKKVAKNHYLNRKLNKRTMAGNF